MFWSITFSNGKHLFFCDNSYKINGEILSSIVKTIFLWILRLCPEANTHIFIFDSIVEPVLDVSWHHCRRLHCLRKAYSTCRRIAPPAPMRTEL